jgi:hypothetical protein
VDGGYRGAGATLERIAVLEEENRSLRAELDALREAQAREDEATKRGLSDGRARLRELQKRLRTLEEDVRALEEKRAALLSAVEAIEPFTEHTEAPRDDASWLRELGRAVGKLRGPR